MHTCILLPLSIYSSVPTHEIQLSLYRPHPFIYAANATRIFTQTYVKYKHTLSSNMRTSSAYTFLYLKSHITMTCIKNTSSASSNLHFFFVFSRTAHAKEQMKAPLMSLGLSTRLDVLQDLTSRPYYLQEIEDVSRLSPRVLYSCSFELLCSFLSLSLSLPLHLHLDANDTHRLDRHSMCVSFQGRAGTENEGKT